MNSLPLALRLALRELRGGVAGFRIVLACLALGVAAIAAIGSLSRAIEAGLRADARRLLGGDLSFQLVHRPVGSAERAWLKRQGDTSETVELRSMVYAVPGNGAAPAPGKDRLLVELKSVDAAYPLYGALIVEGKSLDAKAVAEALAERDGKHGAYADPMLFLRLGLKPGDTIKLGDLQFVLRGAIEREPDRATRLFTLGPRLMISAAALEKSGLVQPGALIYYNYRVALPEGASAAGVAAAAKAQFPEAGWRVRGLDEAAPGLDTFIKRLTLYLTFVGLTALLIGGLGVASGVKAYLDQRTATIATFKCLGAPAGLVFRVYLIEVAILSAVAIALGLALGAVLPALLSGTLEGLIGVRLKMDLYAGPLFMAAAYGALTVLAFSLWSLGQAREVPPGILFRSAIAPPTQRPQWAYIAATVAVAGALAALAILTADNKPLAAIFVVSVVAAFLLFQALAGLTTRAAAAASKGGIERATLRFALANLHRPGAPVARIILSLGLGATVLVAIALIQGNLTREVREQLPDQAPSYFFIDILPHQVKDFEDAVATVPGAKGLTRVPMLRGRIARIDGMTVDEAVQRGRIQPEVRWAVDNERGLTYAATPPAGSEIVAGRWWPADYAGEPLISFDAQLAQGMGLKVGDTIAVNVLGREITGRIANLRRIHWRSLNVNFTIVFSPGVLERAPHSHIASVNVPEASETRLVATVTDKLPNVSAIRVRDALDTAGQVFEQIGFAVRITALVTIAAGLLVLAGAVAAGHRRRIYDAVVFKVLGATRRKILGAFLLEYGLLGLISALLAAGFGSLVAFVILEQAMRIGWSFLPAAAFGTALIAAVTAIGFGFVGIWRAMGQKPAPLLRNE